MATHWGRKETIIWPPHVPLMSYSAVAGALLFTCLLLWQQVRFSLPPLEQAYIGDYMRAGAGAAFHLNGSYRLVYLGGGKIRPRLAFPFDFTRGEMTLPSRKVAPFALAQLARSQGYTFPFRAPVRKYIDASMYRWFHDVVFGGKSLLAVFALRLIAGGIVLVGLLAWAVPADIMRFRQMKYGRVLRGPVMLTPHQFNRTTKGEGVGFVTTEARRMMRIPRRKEAQHFQIMGDTGVGKSQLIMQILRQIRDRKEPAIVYDPACEYIQRFFDAKRGDIVLNPLDNRCPYWGPAQEMESNAEADAIAASLYQRKTDVIDEFFHDTPAQIFAHLLKLGPTPHQLAAWMASETELLKRVQGTEMAFYIDRKAGPQRAGVLSSLGLVAKGFRLLPEKDDFHHFADSGTGCLETLAIPLDRSLGDAAVDYAAAGPTAGVVCDRRTGEFTEAAAASHGNYREQKVEKSACSRFSRKGPTRSYLWPSGRGDALAAGHENLHEDLRAKGGRVDLRDDWQGRNRAAERDQV